MVTYRLANSVGNSVSLSTAMYYLSEDAETNAVPKLLGIVTNTNALDSIRIEAIEALGKMGSASATAVLVEQLKDANGDLRKRSIDALGRIGDDRAVEPLIEMLSDEQARLHAIRALGDIGSTNAIPGLSALVQNEDQYVRYNANQALKDIAGAR